MPFLPATPDQDANDLAPNWSRLTFDSRLGELTLRVRRDERTLHRRLKSLTNESPKEFITRVRIEMACVLLERPGSSVKQVALQCGYGDETSFRRAFNQLVRMTPADYRRWSTSRNGGPTSVPRHSANGD